MRQVALTALYGPKPSAFETFLRNCQALIASVPDIRFRPYAITQIHATLISLERVPDTRCQNLYFQTYRGRAVNMDFHGLLSFIRLGGSFPVQIQIGGYQNRAYAFTTRGRTPYNRCFTIQGDKAVVMGWPVRGRPPMALQVSAIALVHESRTYPTTLDDFRQRCQTFNVLHRYHQASTDVDNDFYFRLGFIDSSAVPPETLHRLEADIRSHLARIEPLILDLELSGIHIAAYVDDTHPNSTTITYSINNPDLTGDLILDLYDRR